MPFGGGSSQWAPQGRGFGGMQRPGGMPPWMGGTQRQQPMQYGGFGGLQMPPWMGGLGSYGMRMPRGGMGRY